MDVKEVITHHFVKSEDLNHHGTLFAGRTAEWFVEAGLMAAAVYVPAKNIVCVKIHGMNFKKPVHLGETVQFASKIVHTGKTSLIANIYMKVQGEEILNGFITFVNTDDSGQALAHGVELKPASAKDLALREQARQLPRS